MKSNPTSPDQTQHQSPNVVVLFTDDQRFDTIGALGNDAISTPNMDRLVSSGVAFTHACIPGGTSAAVCMPSRAMLHTGRSLFRLHDGGRSIPEEHTTLGEMLGVAGYRTFGCGKWHNGTQSFNRSFAEGDEVFFGGMADHWNLPAFHYDPTGAYDGSVPRCPNPMQSNEVELQRCDHIHAGSHSSEIIANAAIDFISQTDRESPFFAYVAFLAPHDPRTMPKRFLDLYDPDTIPLPENFAAGHAFDNGELHVRDEMLAGFPRTAAETRRHIAEYYAMISHLDFEIGRILDTLETRGVADHTIIVLAGDNGLALGQHGLFGKQSLYDHSIRVPLIVSGPGIGSAVIRDESLYLFDLFPTLCDLLQIQVPESVEGRSFAPLLVDASSGYQTRESLYFGYTDKHRAVRHRDYKLIEYVVDGRHTKTQLFDLKNDPWELHNLADLPESRRRVDELSAMMKQQAVAWRDAETPWGASFWTGMETT